MKLVEGVKVKEALRVRESGGVAKWEEGER